jgi:hypothetical protein
MGFLDSIFGGDKPSAKSIEKLVGRVKEAYAQPEYRREAMDKLLSFGTPEAYTAVLTRFTVVVQSPHWDEEEKRWLCDELATRGEPAKTAVRAFLARADHVAFAAKTLLKLSSSKTEWINDLVVALQARPPEDHRTTQGKTEIINQLRDNADETVVLSVLPYVDDHADDVQLAAWECCEHHYPAATDDAKAAVLDRARHIVTDDVRSARVLRHVGGVMSRLKLPVDPTRPLPPAVSEDFVVADGVLVSAR